MLRNDDFNHRVSSSTRTNRVVWQSGRTGVTEPGPGYLNNPDGST